jgi:hypothetical protein
MPMSNQIQKITSTETFDLSKGIGELIKGIQTQYPKMSATEVKAMADALLKQAGRALGNGERLASVNLKSNGDFDINIWHIGPRKSG